MLVFLLRRLTTNCHPCFYGEGTDCEDVRPASAYRQAGGQEQGGATSEHPSAGAGGHGHGREPRAFTSVLSRNAVWGLINSSPSICRLLAGAAGAGVAPRPGGPFAGRSGARPGGFLPAKASGAARSVSGFC